MKFKHASPTFTFVAQIQGVEWHTKGPLTLNQYIGKAKSAAQCLVLTCDSEHLKLSRSEPYLMEAACNT